jgi:hypothetical protein
MFGTCVMLRVHTIELGMPGCFAGAMHRAGYKGGCRTAQRRDPRREQNDNQVDGEQSAHHGSQSTASTGMSPEVVGRVLDDVGLLCLTRQQDVSCSGVKAALPLADDFSLRPQSIY